MMVESCEIRVPDICPLTFPVQVSDRKGRPLAQMTFAVAVDGRKEKTLDTDESGRMVILKPENTIRFVLKSLLSGKNSGSGNDQQIP